MNGLLNGDAQALMALAAEVRKLREERDAAFAMSRCECETNECCANLMRYRDALEAVADLAGWHSDDEAAPDDTSPDDMVAHVNGLIRQRCKAALMGPNAGVTGAEPKAERPAGRGGLEPMLDEDLEVMRAAALLVAAGHAGGARPTREQAETMARGMVELADEVRRLKSVLRAIADPMSFKHQGTPLSLCRKYEDMAETALGSNDRTVGRCAASSRGSG